MPEYKKFSNFSVTNANTAWVFISANTGTVDIFDILWCAQQLLQLSVSPKNIFIFTDHTKAHVDIGQLLADVFISDLDSIEKTYPSLISEQFEHTVAVVAGHGGHMGLRTYNKKVFKPFPLLQILKSGPKIKTVSLILGQCYAGVFNYLNARGEPQVCIMGATNLHQSLAHPTTAEFLVGDGNLESFNWIANRFLLRFFDWLKLKLDLDGDDVVSILDGYRHAAILSNDELRDLRRKNSDLLKKSEVDLAHLISLPTTDLNESLIEKLREEIEIYKLTINHHQEPWVLHADLARSIVIDI